MFHVLYPVDSVYYCGLYDMTVKFEKRQEERDRRTWYEGGNIIEKEKNASQSQSKSI